MRKRETAEITMYTIIAAFLVENEAEFTDFPRLKEEIITFVGLCETMEPLVAKYSAITKGITADKKNAFTQLAALVTKIATVALIFANDHNNQALAAIFNIQPSDFKYQSAQKRILQAQNMVTAITPFIPALKAYNILESNIGAFNNCIMACQSKNLATKTAKTDKKVALAAIQNTQKAARASLKILDLLITSDYADSNPNLLNNYNTSRHIHGKAIRYTGLGAHITDAVTSNALVGATINLPTIKRTATTNAKGVAEIVKMTKGSYQMQCSANGYTPQMVDVKVTRGRVVAVGVRMVVE